MKRAFTALLLAAASAGAGPIPAAWAQTAPAATLEQAIDAVAADVLKNQVSAGFVVGVAENGKIRLVRGYGSADLEHNIPVDAKTVFRIGSISKEFTAAAILLLAERGKLAIDDPLAKFFPDFPRGGEVTIRQLLTHTSGLHNYTSAPEFMKATAPRDLGTDEMVATILKADPLYDFEPGTSYRYSNSGYFVLGAIIEKLSGQTYAAFLKANILDPLGLNNTRLDDLAEIVPNRASGYEKSKTDPTGFANVAHLSMSVAGAAGAVRSTAADLLAWHAALFGGKLLKPNSLALMQAPGKLKDGRLGSASRTPRPGAPAPPGPPSEYGFGLMLGWPSGHRSIGHGGSINGFNAALQSFPDDKLTLVVLTNTDGASAGITPRMIDALFAGRAKQGG